MSLDLKSDADRTLLDGLVAEADVYIQNFRPGTAARLGAGPERLCKLNPHASIYGVHQRLRLDWTLMRSQTEL